jgi:hypothetical protein
MLITKLDLDQNYFEFPQSKLMLDDVVGEGSLKEETPSSDETEQLIILNLNNNSMFFKQMEQLIIST